MSVTVTSPRDLVGPGLDLDFDYLSLGEKLEKRRQSLSPETDLGPGLELDWFMSRGEEVKLL